MSSASPAAAAPAPSLENLLMSVLQGLKNQQSSVSLPSTPPTLVPAATPVPPPAVIPAPLSTASKNKIPKKVKNSSPSGVPAVATTEPEASASESAGLLEASTLAPASTKLGGLIGLSGKQSKRKNKSKKRRTLEQRLEEFIEKRRKDPTTASFSDLKLKELFFDGISDNILVDVGDDDDDDDDDDVDDDVDDDADAVDDDDDDDDDNVDVYDVNDVGHDDDSNNDQQRTPHCREHETPMSLLSISKSILGEGERGSGDQHKPTPIGLLSVLTGEGERGFGDHQHTSTRAGLSSTPKQILGEGGRGSGHHLSSRTGLSLGFPKRETGHGLSSQQSISSLSEGLSSDIQHQPPKGLPGTPTRGGGRGSGRQHRSTSMTGSPVLRTDRDGSVKSPRVPSVSEPATSGLVSELLKVLRESPRPQSSPISEPLVRGSRDSDRGHSPPARTTPLDVPSRTFPTSTFHPGLISAVPMLRDVSPETFVEQVELMFPDPEQAARAARLKLTDDIRFYLDARRQGGTVTWSQIKEAVLSGRKRATEQHESAYFAFRQQDGETIMSAWQRFLGVARAANIKEGSSALWHYFRARLTHSARYAFRDELKLDDPLAALERITAAGDVPFKPTTASMFAFSPQEMSDTMSRVATQILSFSSDGSSRPDWLRNIVCYNCNRFGHKERACPEPPRGSHVSSPSSSSLADSKSEKSDDGRNSGKGGWKKRGDGGHGRNKKWRKGRRDQKSKVDQPDDKSGKADQKSASDKTTKRDRSPSPKRAQTPSSNRSNEPSSKITKLPMGIVNAFKPLSSPL